MLNDHFYSPHFPIARMAEAACACLSVLDLRTVAPPAGMRWKRKGIRWNLYRGSTLIAYVSCACRHYRMCWFATYRPDTTECVPHDSRYSAQRALTHWLANESL